MHRQEKSNRWPPWLVGLVIAIVVFAILFAMAKLLGFGDDPAIGLIVSFSGR